MFLSQKALTSILLATLLTTSGLSTASVPEQSDPLPARILVLTDIGSDPDDTQTLIRFLLYANQFDIEGMVATTSVHKQDIIGPELIHQVIDAYSKVQENLNRHETGYPSAKALRERVKQGLPLYGMEGVGHGKDSEGSDWIIEVLERDDPRPLWISVWGGPNTLAQALYQLKKSKTPEQLQQLVSKLRVYTISDQDDSAAWIRSTFPDLFYIVSPGGYGAATWIGMLLKVDGIDNRTISNPWIAENIQQDHGPLGALYPDISYGVEGDTPSWLNLIPNGLNHSEKPAWGGWGGRYELYTPNLEDTNPEGFTGGVPVNQETRPIWTNAFDTVSPVIPADYGRAQVPMEQSFTGYRETLWRWRDEIQNDFAARLDWTFKRYKEANHPPVPALNHPQHLTVISGENFYLNAQGSTDPDGDSLSYYWFNYPEPGTLKDQTLQPDGAPNMSRVHFVAPNVSKRETLHFILKVTDKGEPALTRYKRVIVDVVPN